MATRKPARIVQSPLPKADGGMLREPSAVTARSKRKSVGAKLPVKSVAAKLPAVSRAGTKAAKRKFEQGVLARGEAVRAGSTLPPAATHEIVGETPEGKPILKRKRFSLT